MNARGFRETIETLKESGCIEEIRQGVMHTYKLIKEAKP
jgi:hypothetical protein